MHILSELRNPLFDAPERQRALEALDKARIIHEKKSDKAWQTVKNMIEKAISDHSTSPRAQSHSMEQPLESSTSKTVFRETRTAASYALKRYIGSYNQPTLAGQPPPSQPSRHTMQPQLHSMQDTRPVQAQAPCWDDMNLSNINNIVGDVLPNADIIPDFDFVSSNATRTDEDIPADQSQVFWGDPFNYNLDPAAMQDGSYLPQWIG